MFAFFSKWLDWNTPTASAFEFARLGVELGHERGACLARRQGRCPGRDQCADCPWAEGWTRSSAQG